MSSTIFKINNVATGLGVIKTINEKLVSNRLTLEGITAGEKPESIKNTESYKIFAIQAMFIDTEANINTFDTALTNAEKNNTQCQLQLRYWSSELNVLVNNFDIIDNGGIPGRIDYILTLLEGTPLV